MVVESVKRDAVLIIDDDPFMLRTMEEILHKTVTDIHVLSTENPLDGIQLFKEHIPCIVIIDANMPIMNGFVVCSIIRKMEKGDRTTIYMISANNEETHIRQAYQAGVDFYFDKPINEANFTGTIIKFFEKRAAVSAYFLEMEKARRKQIELLPKRITRPDFMVDYIYSPYEDLSGDFVDYWLEQDRNGLCGYLFDVAGHDICSALQVSAARTMFKYGFNFYSRLNEVIGHVNQEMCRLNSDLQVAGLAFRFDFQTSTLYFCSAGIISFFLMSQDKFVEIPMNGFLLGFKPDSEFEEKSIQVNNVDNVIFSSDGFSELLVKNEGGRVLKHDDVSAIMIRFKKNK